MMMMDVVQCLLNYLPSKFSLFNPDIQAVKLDEVMILATNKLVSSSSRSSDNNNKTRSSS